MEVRVEHLTGQTGQTGPAVTVVHLRGEIDVSTSGRLRDQLSRVIASGGTHLVLDLGGVSFIDSTGLSVLAGLHRSLRTIGGSVVLAAVNQRVRRVLRTSGLTRLFAIYRSTELAVLAHTAHTHRDPARPPRGWPDPAGRE